jgi:hypothetical protein
LLPATTVKVNMKIAASTVAMESRHLALTSQVREESLRIWTNQGRGNSQGPQTNRVDLSQTGRARYATESSATTADESRDGLDPRLLLVLTMIERLTGRKVRLFNLGDVQPASAPIAGSAPSSPPASTSNSGGVAIAYDASVTVAEHEQTQFSAQGQVLTSDGQTIDFRIELNMARSHVEHSEVHLRLGDAPATDPLVINFNGRAAELTEQRFSFDLNSDGSSEQLPMLAAGSGYLALDKNSNGRIDSGVELFGPRTGSGFAELASLDSDGNGWIDESDPAFAQLRIWTPDAQGDGALATLTERRVGALYTGSVTTPFALKDAANGDLGAVAATGVYLGEDGGAGTLQEIDLVV